jgi:hypothetical protein
LVDQLSEEIAIEDDAAVLQVGEAVTEWDERAFAIGQLNLKQIARSEVLDTRDSADRLAVRVHAGQPKEIGVIIFALFQRRQIGAVDFDQFSAKGLGR